jgi:CRP-like cAMP-binding protein
MKERLPLVSPLERAWFIGSQRPLLGLDPDIVAVIAAYMREVFVRKGTVLKKEGLPVDYLYYLVEGRLRIEYEDQTFLVTKPPGNTGLLWALANWERGPGYYADTDTVVLQIGVEPFFDILEDYFPLVLRLYELLFRDLVAVQKKLGRPPELSEPQSIDCSYPEHPLDLVEQLGWAMQCSAFKSVNLAALSQLLRVHPEIRLKPGQSLWKQDDPAEHLVLVVYGNIRCTSTHQYRNHIAGPGTIVGMEDTLIGERREFSATAESRAILIRIDRQTYLDVLEDNFDLALLLLRFCATAILTTRQQLRKTSKEADQTLEPYLTVMH